MENAISAGCQVYQQSACCNCRKKRDVGTELYLVFQPSFDCWYSVQSKDGCCEQLLLYLYLAENPSLRGLKASEALCLYSPC